MSTLLGVLYDHELQLPSYRAFTLIQDLVDLADKWEIVSVNKLARKEIFASIYRHDRRQLDLFVLAIKLNDMDLAARIIEMSNDEYTLRVLIGTDGNRSRINIDVITLANWEHKDLAKIPPNVAWALQKAAMMWDHNYGSNTDSEDEKKRRRQAIGENFRRIMDASCALSPPLVLE